LGPLSIELKKPGVTLLILWEEYRSIHPDGYGYSRFCELFRGFEKRLSPTMRQEHVAGDKVCVDYSGKKVPIVDRKTGEIREAELFLGVLGASSFTYAEATGPRPCRTGLARMCACSSSSTVCPG
jgi:transposase